ncbi:MAG TPA: hypothetical protein DCQ26_19720 [Marinilabiliales bacterium]|nr:MAG: hypothetical protein A2W95_16725 [Bacteroidetes bacterium GWA2_40_14]OFX62447.1 MAG: hypothetical protein A2W84_12675 [Bacteroidetes bacterium GWC2_40_13]OFX72265.1 MAG: hypothetical protein A2W96_17645 [Bacteroidetes bacterium GWD2_40_43]OFX90487.1 MAG: hypothetical protein A2W97_01755 [Bacteroidetes bacterium GWE2_40_63]OFY17267.1 MAG: hypothetical protein A2W88_15110 [Bacteroidetes bacterium GWF2_40_13]OFZ29099.1 MAG: hypothetical protein A2437_16075 [Bacteroidetes bacterium RIFOXYC
MNEITKYKKKILVNFVLLLALSFISVIVTIGAAQGFKNQTGSILLLVLFLIQIPIILNLGLNGLKAVNSYLEFESKRIAAKNDDIEELEREVEEKAKEADDLSFNLTRLGEDIEATNDWEAYGQSVLLGFSKQIEIVVGMVYQFNHQKQKYSPVATYAYYSDLPPHEFASGDGLSGQVVKDQKAMFLSELPDGYVKVMSGLGAQKPRYLSLLPITYQNQVIGLVEMATFVPVERGLAHKSNEIAELLGKKAANIIV